MSNQIDLPEDMGRKLYEVLGKNNRLIHTWLSNAGTYFVVAISRENEYNPETEILYCVSMSYPFENPANGVLLTIDDMSFV